MARGTRRALVSPAAFWDASALVPLCVNQTNSAAAKSLYDHYEIVVWWGTSVEIASAVARLLRMSLIKRAEWNHALKIASILANTWFVIEPSVALRTKAEHLVQIYDLRAADAFQLAAALEWCKDTPGGEVFLTADERLLQAALLAGFDANKI
jgi:predicted nucleic acid-binding protein